jgi:para-nitrobenzyl esterase
MPCTKTPTVQQKIAIVLACAAWAAPAYAAPTATTQNGRVTGVAAEGMDEFLGIRYAAPPLGALRWQPPQPVPQAMATKTATSFGGHCAQPPSAYGTASSTEDCLFLNVFAPAGKRQAGAKPLPVMVWIHGGALLVGESDSYDPVRLVNTGDVIVVTINYRLGYFGFLAESGLDAEGHVAANYGLQDQQFALDWVRRNIAGFGGDPAKVTVFGESAGGLSVLSNLVSPTAYGLFSRALVESGAYALTLPSLSAAEASGNAIAAGLGCAAADTACLRAATVSQVLTAEATAGLSVTTIVDGTTLPLSINAALKGGKFNRVPVLNGSNHDEYRLFLPADVGLTAAQYPDALAGIYGPAFGAAIAAEYPVGKYAKPVYALAAVITDQTFACGARAVDRWISPYEPVYAYEFNDRRAPEGNLPPVPGYHYGAAHAIEIPFIFDTPELPGTRAFTPAEQRLSDTMVKYWTAFARAGQPDEAGVPGWTPYANRSGIVQSLVAPTPAPETGLAGEHHCTFWQPLLDPS